MKVTSKDLKQLVLKGKIQNIYLFTGPELGEKKEIIELIEKQIFKDSEPVKFTFYCGDYFDLSEFINSLTMGQLFSSVKLVILKNIENIDTKTINFIKDYILPKEIDGSLFENKILRIY